MVIPVDGGRPEAVVLADSDVHRTTKRKNPVIIPRREKCFVCCQYGHNALIPLIIIRFDCSRGITLLFICAHSFRRAPALVNNVTLATYPHSKKYRPSTIHYLFQFRTHFHCHRDVSNRILFLFLVLLQSFQILLFPDYLPRFARKISSFPQGTRDHFHPRETLL